MTKIDTVYVHHPELDAEAQVPEETVPAWEVRGWVAGRLPGAAEAEQALVDADVAAALATNEPAGAPEIAPSEPETVPSRDTSQDPYPTEEDSE